jgi:hypothetical protein
MESLKQNKALLYSVLGSGGTVLALTLGIVPELAAQFEIIDFPPDVSFSRRKSSLLTEFVTVSNHPVASVVRRLLLFVPRRQNMPLGVRRRQNESILIKRLFIGEW